MRSDNQVKLTKSEREAAHKAHTDAGRVLVISRIMGPGLSYRYVAKAMAAETAEPYKRIAIDGVPIDAWVLKQATAEVKTTLARYLGGGSWEPPGTIKTEHWDKT